MKKILIGVFILITSCTELSERAHRVYIEKYCAFSTDTVSPPCHGRIQIDGVTYVIPNSIDSLYARCVQDNKVLEIIYIPRHDSIEYRYSRTR